MTEGQDIAAKPGLFYGWVMVAALLLLLSVGMGTTMYMYSVVAGAVGQEFTASRTALMLGSTGMFFMLGFLSPLLGSLLDRYSSKWILTFGAIFMGLGFILIALSTHIWMAVASYILFVSMGMTTLSTLTTATLLTRWFVSYRGLAIGVATLGTQLGGFLYPPIFAAVMEAYSWRIAIAGLGVLVMTVVPAIIWLLVVDRPEEKSQRAYGDTGPAEVASDQAKNPVAVPKLAFTRLLAQPNFLLVVLIAGAVVVTNTALLANLSLFATDLGEPAVRGAFLVSLVALLGIFCSPLIGWLCDVIHIKWVTALVTTILAAACLTFSVANHYSLLLVAAFLQGIGGGGVFPLWASLVGHLYHTQIYGRVMGASTMVISIFTALSPLFAGAIHDWTGSYRSVFLSFLLMLVVAGLLIPLIRTPRDETEKFGA